MATQLTTDEMKAFFPGALEALFDGNEFEVEDYLKQVDDGDSEHWVHEGVLYDRTWWPAYGWHYAEWTGVAWKCPDTGEIVCPWGTDPDE